MKKLNAYETKQAEKKERYAHRAEKLKAEAKMLSDYDDRCMSLIPAGQPILVGHHSEKGHRGYLKRSRERLDKIGLLLEKAKHYEYKSTASNTTISSDDESAIKKLRDKLTKLEAGQVEMKRVNSEYRKTGDINAIRDLTDAKKSSIKEFFVMFPYHKTPYPAYMLTNNGAEIRRIKKRVVELEQRQKMAPREEVQGNGYVIKENKEDNRIWVIFGRKPSREICQIMRHSGFKWSPSRSAWVRMLSLNGQYVADSLAKKIAAI